MMGAFEKTYPRARVWRIPAGAWIFELDHGHKVERDARSFASLTAAFNKATLTVDNRRHGVTPKGGASGSSRPTHCPSCHRPVRRNNEKAADHPGTVPMRLADGTCSPCSLTKAGKRQRTRSNTPDSDLAVDGEWVTKPGHLTKVFVPRQHINEQKEPQP